MRDAGFRQAALAPLPEGHPLSRLRFNPMHLLWEKRLDEISFVKVEVLRDRMTNVELETAFKKFNELSPQQSKLINLHIQRCRRKSTASTVSIIIDIAYNILLKFYSMFIKQIDFLYGNKKFVISNYLSILIMGVHGVYIYTRFALRGLFKR